MLCSDTMADNRSRSADGVLVVRYSLSLGTRKFGGTKLGVYMNRGDRDAR